VSASKSSDHKADVARSESPASYDLLSCLSSSSDLLRFRDALDASRDVPVVLPMERIGPNHPITLLSLPIPIDTRKDMQSRAAFWRRKEGIYR
jgi:hypothetical protein